MCKKSLFLLLMIPLYLACTKNAFTGRKSLSLFPDSSINQMSFAEYKTFLTQNKTLNAGSDVEMVRRVGQDIRSAVEVYYRAKNQSKDLQGFAWEFNVVDDPNTVNAFCMPGGKVVVYTGILKVTQNENALAVVMGHEIGHALAKHGNERMSQQVVAQLGLSSLDLALSQKSTQTRNILLQAAGAGAQVGVLLPFSRTQESEADEIGLYLMAMAGYNPAESVPFWQRMDKMGGSRPPEFLSTHPDPTNRVKRLQALIPKARGYAQKYPATGSSKYHK